MKNAMRANRTKIVVAVLLMILTGCSSNYKSFKLSNVDEGEGVVIGKVDVAYNNEPYKTDLCEFCIGETCHDLLKEGYVFMPLKSGQTQSTLSLKCHYIGGPGDLVHKFNISSFPVKPGVVYFGNLYFDVKAVLSNQVPPEGVLPEKRYSGRGAVLGGLGSVLYPGGAVLGGLGSVLYPERKRIVVEVAQLTVKDEMHPVLEAFQRQAGNGSAQVGKNLVAVGEIPQAGEPMLIVDPSNHKNFRLSGVTTEEGVVIGKVELTYNQKPYNSDYCLFCIGSICHDPLEEGYVFMPLKTGMSHSNLTLQCLYTGGGLGEFYHRFKISPVEVKPGVTYVGTFHFEANAIMSNQASPDMVLPQETNRGGAVGKALEDAGINASTERKPRLVVGLTLSIRDEMSTVMEAFQQQVGNTEAPAEKNIVTVGTQAGK